MLVKVINNKMCYDTRYTFDEYNIIKCMLFYFIIIIIIIIITIHIIILTLLLSSSNCGTFLFNKSFYSCPIWI